MTSNLKHKPLIGEILPGSLVIGFLMISYLNNNRSYVDYILKDTVTVILTSGILIVCAWIIGTVFDAVRNGIVEVCLDRRYPIYWDFFFKGNIEKVHQLEEYYFAYYVLELNIIIGLMLVIVFHFPVLCFFNFPYIELSRLPWWGWVAFIFVVGIFLNDSICLRQEIRDLLINMDDKDSSSVPLPHKKAYTRLKPSTVHGVGVFAIRDIPRGTNIFADDSSNVTWINESDIENLVPEIRKLYLDFCVKKGVKYYCPTSFNNLTVGWYINHSKDNPNVLCTNDYDFIAITDIQNGAELLVNYNTYSEKPERLLS